MSRGIAVRTAVPAAVLAAGALLLSVVSMAPPAGAAKSQSAPVFSGKSTAKGKQGTPLDVTVKTKANPTATLSVTTPLPPGARSTTTGTAPARCRTRHRWAAPTPSDCRPPTSPVRPTRLDETLTLAVKSKLPAIRHVFVIMLENNDYAATFGAPSVDPYWPPPAHPGRVPEELLRHRPLLERQLRRLHLGQPAQRRQPARLPRFRLCSTSPRLPAAQCIQQGVGGLPARR